MITDWDFASLEGLIERRGDQVIHEIAVACACRSSDFYAGLLLNDGRVAKRKRINCDQCQGNGWYYRQARLIKGLVTSINSGNRSGLQLFRVEPGDCTFSPSLKERIISDFDRITFLTSAPINDGQVILRNAANLGDNKARDTGLTEDEDRLMYEPDCTLWCEDSEGNIYSQGDDFVFDGKKLRWVGNRPLDGVFYTIKYTAYLEWLCYVTPMTRFDRARNLGQRVLLRKLHVAFPNVDAQTAAERQDDQIKFTNKTSI